MLNARWMDKLLIDKLTAQTVPKYCHLSSRAVYGGESMDKRLSLEMFIVCNLYLLTAHAHPV